MSDASTKTPPVNSKPAGGGVLRKHLTERFTQIPNETIRDSRLSFRAVGLLVHILSLPDGTRIGGRALMNAHVEGRDAVLAALRELTVHGYYATTKVHHEDGTYTTYVTVADTPVLNDTTESGKPGPGKPGPGKPGLKTQTPTPEHLTLVQPDGSTSVRGFPTAAAIRTGTPYPAAFVAFWDIYPRRIGKTAAYKAWLARLNDARRAGISIERRTSAMVQAAANYATHVRDQDTDTQFVKHPSTFLGPDDHWKDWAVSAAPEAGSRQRTPRDPNE